MYSLIKHHRKHGFAYKALYQVSGMLFFWTLFDGILGYMIPFLIKERGISTTKLGLIYASSSIIGAVFDFIASQIFRNTKYRRFYLYMFVLSGIALFLTWQANHIILFMIVMGIWGIYYDFHNLGNFDFVHREAKHEEHSSFFGVINVFRSLGYLIAPIIAGAFLVYTTNFTPLLIALGFLLISFLIYFSFVRKPDKSLQAKNNTPQNPSVYREIVLWKKVGKNILPVLIFVILLSIFTSFVTTIGPLFTEELARQHFIGLLFMPMFLLPNLLMGWFEGKVTNRFGVKKTAYYSGILGALVLVSFFFVHSVYLIIPFVFISACFTSLSLPAVNAFFEDYIDEFPEDEHEVEGLSDFFFNIGYILGPAMAGILTDLLGLRQTFGALGGIVALCTILVILFDRRVKYSRNS